MNNSFYQAALNNVVWRDMSHFGRFEVSGNDAAALLHHLTTNDIKALKVGEGCEAALINSKARLLDLLSIFRRDNDFLVVTSPNRRAMFEAHLRSFVLYRQDLKVRDISESGALFGLFGAQTPQTLLRVLDSASTNVTPADNARADNVRADAADFAAESARFLWRNFVCNSAQCATAPTSRLPRIASQNGALLRSDSRAQLEQIVRESGAPWCDNETYNVLRVESGVPATGLELTEDFNPWEANLKHAISLHKGCYNGQEIVARLNTYQKVKRTLCGLKLTEVAAGGTKLRYENRDAGTITSSVNSPRFGPIALAYLRGDSSEIGRDLQIQTEGSAPEIATVCALPFT